MNRPAYHFWAEGGVGRPLPFFWAGRHHVFYQAGRPEGARLDHVVSDDLIRWRAAGAALLAGPEVYDSAGCRIGSIVEHGGQFFMFYTGFGGGGTPRPTQCLAVSGDLERWSKHPANPIIADLPAGFGPCFRDPFVWRDGGLWRMVVGSQLDRGQGGAGLMYESADLVAWRYAGPFCEAHVNDSGRLFECPDFFPFGRAGCLLTSCGKTFWHGGMYHDGMFFPEKGGPVDGGEFYAGRTATAGDGRRILWGQIGQNRPGRAGSGGVLSLPRVLSAGDDGLPVIQPAEELTQLRRRHWHFENLRVSDGAIPLEGVAGGRLEVRIEFEQAAAEEIGLMLGSSPDKSDLTEEFEKKPKICLRPNEGFFEDISLESKNNQQVVLHAFFDGPVIEAFANGRACMTYLSPVGGMEAGGLSIFARGGSVIIITADVWEISSE